MNKPRLIFAIGKHAIAIVVMANGVYLLQPTLGWSGIAGLLLVLWADNISKAKVE